MMLRHPNLKVLKVHKTIYIYTLYRIRAVLHSSLDPLDQFLFDVPVNLLFLWSVPSLVRLAGGNLSQEKVPFRKKIKKKKKPKGCVALQLIDRLRDDGYTLEQGSLTLLLTRSRTRANRGVSEEVFASAL